MTKMSESSNMVEGQGAFGVIFENLKPSDDPLTINIVRTVFKNSGESIVAGRDHMGLAHLIIPFTGESQDVSLGQLTEGLKVQAVVYPDGRKYLDFQCLEQRSDDIFGAICNSLCVEIHADGQLSAASLRAAVSREIERWKAILASLFSQEPSQSEIIGLLGELVVLRTIVKIDPQKGLKSWFGPDQSRHDFEFASHAIEVKTTTRVASKSVEVHGKAQLSAAPGSSLKLTLIQVERALDGLCIANLLEEIVDAGVTRADLAAKLLKWFPAGIAQLPSWASQYSFKLTAITTYAVDDDFPIPDPSKFGPSVEPRVTSFSCTLNLDGLAGRVDDEASLPSLLSGFIA